VQAAPVLQLPPELSSARILERDGLDDAAASWSRIGDEYPTDEFASTALLFAGTAVSSEEFPSRTTLDRARYWP
jgi:hypothetical protein